MTDTALSLIEQSALLSDSDAATLRNALASARHSFAVTQIFRTPTEMRVGVLNDFEHPTPDSKYWQAVREQDVHMTELVHLSYEYRKVGLEIKRLQRRLATETDDLEREALQLEIEHQTYIAALMARTAAHRVREVAAWAAIKEELEPHLKYGTEDVNAHQLEAMRIRWANEAKLITSHTPPADARNIIGLAVSAEREAQRGD